MAFPATPLVTPYSPTGYVNQAALDTAYVGPLNALAAAVNAAGPACVLLRRTTTLALPSGTATRPGTYDGTPYQTGDITFSGGTITVARAGMYMWSASLQFVSGTGLITGNVEINGVAFGLGKVTSELSTAHQVNMSPGGPIQLAAGDSIILVITSQDVASTVTPLSFSLLGPW